VNFDLEIDIETTLGIFTIWVDVTYNYYEGYDYDSNGEGCSASADMEFKILNVYAENGDAVNLPDVITEADIEDEIWSHIENTY
jgi:hypothetical protein